jgi:hypothetical protein
MNGVRRKTFGRIYHLFNAGIRSGGDNWVHLWGLRREPMGHLFTSIGPSELLAFDNTVEDITVGGHER